MSFQLTKSKFQGCTRSGEQVWKSEIRGLNDKSPFWDCERSVYIICLYAAIISLRTDLFCFASPEQSNKGSVLSGSGPIFTSLR